MERKGRQAMKGSRCVIKKKKKGRDERNGGEDRTREGFALRPRLIRLDAPLTVSR